MEAAAPITPNPSWPNIPVGRSGEKFSPLSKGMLRTMKAVSATILMPTRTALTEALSLVPRTRSQVTAPATRMAGRLMTPWLKSTVGMKPLKPHAGPLLKNSGNPSPVVCWISPIT